MYKKQNYIKIYFKALLRMLHTNNLADSIYTMPWEHTVRLDNEQLARKTI